jgi:hypothetical protein
MEKIHSEALSLTVAGYRQRWLEMIIWAVVIVYSTIAVQEISRHLYLTGQLAMFALAFVVGFIVLTAVSIGYARVAFSVVDKRRLSVREALANKNVFISYVVTTSTMQVGLFVGVMALLVPGVLFLIVFGFAPLLVIDEKLRPIAAYKRSRDLTRGVRLNIFFIYAIALFLAIIIIGPWSLLPAPIGQGLGYAALTIVFSFLTVMSAAVTRVLQQRYRTRPAAERY